SHDSAAGTLRLRFPDGRELGGRVELGEPEQVDMDGRPLAARPVAGELSAALSDHCGLPLRLFAAPADGEALDRGPEGAVTLLSVASLERLRAEAGATEPVDPRRFRMTFGVTGLGAHDEDAWIDRDVRVGGARVRVSGNVGRCALTTRNADTGVVDSKTLHHLAAYRREVETTEPLPFGVYAHVVEPGRVRVGDPVLPA
ncbi:MAG: MOSC domain-containing protein, partial [Thermoleophilaceae bacterium]|nr:MOSC domain-containing protein [Thermoleophilaceae bacterium]